MAEPEHFRGMLQGSDFVTDQEGCARCGADGHPSIQYKAFTQAIQLNDGGVITHWAVCPALFEPILLVVSDDG